MTMRSLFYVFLTGASMVVQLRGSVITGTIINWDESGPNLTIGDGTNHVQMWWSTYNLDKGWFYGSYYGHCCPFINIDSDVSGARGITDISQITAAANRLLH